ncbi:MAG: hypothetical protein V4671_32700 [Armatimonadota bacterium]
MRHVRSRIPYFKAFVPIVSRENFLCGGVLLAFAGWIALHPPPKAPHLPSVLNERVGSEAEREQAKPVKRPLVWLDIRKGIYYFAGFPEYGHSDQGKYMPQDEALEMGYRSCAKKSPEEIKQP